MTNLIALGSLAAVMAISFPLALLLVWLSLSATFRLMPARSTAQPARVRTPRRYVTRRTAPARAAVLAQESPRAFTAGLNR